MDGNGWMAWLDYCCPVTCPGTHCVCVCVLCRGLVHLAGLFKEWQPSQSLQGLHTVLDTMKEERKYPGYLLRCLQNKKQLEQGCAVATCCCVAPHVRDEALCRPSRAW